MDNIYIINNLTICSYQLEENRFAREKTWLLIDEIKKGKLSTNQIVSEINTIVNCIKGDNTVKANLITLNKNIL